MDSTNNGSLPPSPDGPIPEAGARSTPAPQRFDFDREIAEYERRERRWTFRKSAAKLTIDQCAEAFYRRHERWTRGQNLAEASDFRVDPERLDSIIDAALNVEVALGRDKALLEHDLDRFDFDNLDALRAHCEKYDRRPIIARRVAGAVEYLDLARSDLILSLLLELRNWRKLARKFGRELRDQYDRQETVRVEIAEHEYQYFKDWCRERDESDESLAVIADSDNAVTPSN